MINLLIFLTSFLIQFGAVDFPINATLDYNVNSSDLVNTMVNNINGLHDFNIDITYVIVTTRNNSDYPYTLYVPKETIDNSSSSTWSVVDRTDNYIQVTMWGFYRFYMTANGSIVNSALNTGSVGKMYFDSSVSSGGIIYVGNHYNLPYSGTDTFIFTLPPNIKQDHASGWSSLIEETDNGTYTVTGHSNGAITNENSFWLVDATSDLTHKLLTGIANIISGISDSVSYGLGEIKNYFVSFSNWIQEPLNHDNFILMLNSSILGPLLDLDLDFKNRIPEHQDIIISWDLGNVAYFGGASGSINLSHKLNSSKNIWQPLLLTFLYATTTWGLFKSIPNIFSGVSPLSDNPKHEQKKGGKKP